MGSIVKLSTVTTGESFGVVSVTDEEIQIANLPHLQHWMQGLPGLINGNAVTDRISGLWTEIDSDPVAVSSLGGQPAIEAGDVTVRLDSSPLTGSYTLVAIFETSASPQNAAHTIFGGSTASDRMVVNWSTVTRIIALYHGAGFKKTTELTVGIGVPSILFVGYDADTGNVWMRLNGIEENLGTITALADPSIQIGSYYSGSGKFEGVISDCFILSEVLNGAKNRAIVDILEAWAVNRYGVVLA